MKQIYILITVLFLSYINLNAQVTDVVIGLSRPIGLVLNGDDLYIAEYSGNKISKIDITAPVSTATDVVTGLNAAWGLLLINNDLYISESYGDKISKIDITTPMPTTTNVVSGLNFPTGIILNGNDLYIAEYSSNKISKFHLATLSIDDNSLVKSISFFPNPSSHFISVSGLTKIEKFRLFNILGVEVNNGIISNNGKINIQDLTNGMYFLKFESGSTLKLIKE